MFDDIIYHIYHVCWVIQYQKREVIITLISTKDLNPGSSFHSDQISGFKKRKLKIDIEITWRRMVFKTCNSQSKFWCCHCCNLKSHSLLLTTGLRITFQSKGRVRLPKRMNFQKNSKRPLNPMFHTFSSYHWFSPVNCSLLGMGLKLVQTV